MRRRTVGLEVPPPLAEELSEADSPLNLFMHALQKQAYAFTL